MDTVEKVWGDKSFHVATIVAVVIVLLMVLMAVFQRLMGKEHIVGDPLVAATSYTSGASQRFGQEPTATNQGGAPTYIQDLPQELRNPGPAKSERLVNGREAPVFYEIGDELAAYRYGEGAQDVGDITASEHLSNPLQNAADMRLMDKLVPGYSAAMLS